jgi:tetratricopeptide (TPR) repeat protein
LRFAERLAAAERSALDLTDLRRRMREPWLWPSSAREVALARERFPSCEPKPGQVLLVSVSRVGGAGALWRLEFVPTGVTRPPCPVAIAADVGARIEDLKLSVMRDLPLLNRTAAPAPGSWFVSSLTETRDLAVTGASYSASIFLAWASLLMQRPLPAHFAASADVQSGGALGRVEGLREKLRVVEQEATAVTRFCVSADQVDEAKSCLSAGSGLEVVGCASVAELLEAAFLSFELPQWPDAATRLAFVRNLYGLAMFGRRPMIGWRCVANAAEQLDRQLEDSPVEQQLARSARAVAIRHEPRGQPIPPLEWIPGAGALPRPLRLSLLGQVLQQGTDGANRALPELIAEAKRLSPPREERCIHALGLRGALGRALARLRRYDEAATVLREAVEGFRESFLSSEAGRPLCELLRVLPHAGTREGALAEAEALVALAAGPELEDSLDAMSKAFLAVSVGRALVQLGQPARAIDWLQGRYLREAPLHVTGARDRWFARAKDALGDHAGADALRAGMAHLVPTDDCWDQAQLGRLDQCVRDGGDPQPLLAELRVVAHESLDLLLDGVPPEQVLRVVLEEYPY